MAAFRVKLGANDLNCVDVPLNLLTVGLCWCGSCYQKKNQTVRT